MFSSELTRKMMYTISFSSLTNPTSMMKFAHVSLACIGITLLVLFIVNVYIQQIMAFTLTYSNRRIQITIDYEDIDMEVRRPLILGWNQFHRRPFSFELQKLNQCPFKCNYTLDQGRIAEADVIIFHGGNLFDSALPPLNNSKQLRALYIRESPGRDFRRYYQGWDNISLSYFNITMTYLHRSDYWERYNSLERRRNGDAPFYTEAEIDAAISQKVQGSFFLASHCGAESGRDEVVNELARFTDVNRFGNCTGARKCDGDCAKKQIESHFFYLALENSICEEYITEKFFKLKNLVVPITFKRSLLARLAPPDSFIAIDDFCSLEELGNYLNYLMGNKQKYKNLFNWTQRYRNATHLSSLCYLCRDLHFENVTTTDYSKDYTTIRSFMPTSQCKNFLGLKLKEGRCMPRRGRDFDV